MKLTEQQREWLDACNQPVFENVGVVYEKADLSPKEIEVFERYREYSHDWLMHAKRHFALKINDDPSLIQRLARLLLLVDRGAVTGPKIRFIKALFGKPPYHQLISHRFGGFRICRRGDFHNRFYELQLLGYFVANEFQVELCQEERSKKTPEFVVKKASLEIAVEAKSLDVDAILDKVFGCNCLDGCFTPEDVEARQAQLSSGLTEEQQVAITRQFERNYENAMAKLRFCKSSWAYLIFINYGWPVSLSGERLQALLDSLPAKWVELGDQRLLGLVVDAEPLVSIWNPHSACGEVVASFQTIPLKRLQKFRSDSQLD